MKPNANNAQAVNEEEKKTNAQVETNARVNQPQQRTGKDTARGAPQPTGQSVYIDDPLETPLLYLVWLAQPLTGHSGRLD